VTMNSWFRI